MLLTTRKIPLVLIGAKPHPSSCIRRTSTLVTPSFASQHQPPTSHNDDVPRSWPPWQNACRSCTFITGPIGRLGHSAGTMGNGMLTRDAEHAQSIHGLQESFRSSVCTAKFLKIRGGGGKSDIGTGKGIGKRKRRNDNG